MIIVTGGAGFIGSAFIWKLNQEGIDDILVVDELGESDKWKNLVNRRYVEYIHKDVFLRMIRNDQMPFTPRAIIHMGACSSTTERDADYLMDNNYHYTCRLAEWALPKNIRFMYASSAATYGDGSRGFSDDSSVTPDASTDEYVRVFEADLRPLGTAAASGKECGGHKVLQRLWPE